MNACRISMTSIFVAFALFVGLLGVVSFRESVVVTRGTSCEVRFFSGQLTIFVPRIPASLHGLLDHKVISRREFLGVTLVHTAKMDFRGGSQTFRIVSVPLWLVGLALLIPVVLAVVQNAFNRRKMRSLKGTVCDSCGYDLTGNVSGRCPECGEVIPSN